MQAVTIGPKYQIVIPKEVRKKLKGIKPGNKIVVGAIDENTATIKTEPKSWIEQYSGIAKEAWKGIDTTRYLKRIRDEWERKY